MNGKEGESDEKDTGTDSATKNGYQLLESDEQGRPISEKNGEYYYTSFYDDEIGTITKYYSQSPFDGNNYESKIVIQSVEKNEFGSVLIVTYEHDGISSVVEYDEDENITREVSEKGVASVYKYQNGKIFEKISPYTGTCEDDFHTTRYEYDQKGRKCAEYIPAGEKADPGAYSKPIRIKC